MEKLYRSQAECLWATVVFTAMALLFLAVTLAPIVPILVEAYGNANVEADSAGGVLIERLFITLLAVPGSLFRLTVQLAATRRWMGIVAAIMAGSFAILFSFGTGEILEVILTPGQHLSELEAANAAMRKYRAEAFKSRIDFYALVCNKCGERIGDEGRYCRHCGADQDPRSELIEPVLSEPGGEPPDFWRAWKKDPS